MDRDGPAASEWHKTMGVDGFGDSLQECMPTRATVGFPFFQEFGSCCAIHLVWPNPRKGLTEPLSLISTPCTFTS